jgi:hypothetical protein
MVQVWVFLNFSKSKKMVQVWVFQIPIKFVKFMKFFKVIKYHTKCVIQSAFLKFLQS